MAEDTTPSSTISPFLTLYTFEKPQPNKHSISPFVAKLHFRLRHSGVDFDVQHGSRGNAPKGKIPFVKFHEPADNGDGKGKAQPVTMGDSALITQRLISLGKLPDLSAALSPKERAHDLAIRALVEDRMYFLLVRERWLDNFSATISHGPYKWLPWGARHIMAAAGYVFCKTMLHLQGVGRYGDDEAESMLREGLGALEALVAEVSGGEEGKGKSVGWVLGKKEATEADFALFGMLIGLRGSPMHPRGSEILKEHPILMQYLDMILERYYPEFEKV